MFAELSKVMEHSLHEDMYLNSLNQNIANKKTKNNKDKTTSYLKQLYGFDIKYPPFKLFKYFWQIAAEKDKPVITLLYALGEDFLLGESYPVVASTKLGDKVGVRLNIRPFITADVLRKKPNIKWGVDRGKNPPGSFWGEVRDNDLHKSLEEKRKGREIKK